MKIFKTPQKTCAGCNDGIVKAGRPANSLYCSNSCRKRRINDRAYRKAKTEGGSAYDYAFSVKGMLNTIRYRARKEGIEYSLSVENIMIPEFCPVLGLKLEFSRGRGQGFYQSPSIDRIDPRKGYVAGNIRVISHRANSLKSNATLQELLLVVEDSKRLNASSSPD